MPPIKSNTCITLHKANVVKHVSFESCSQSARQLLQLLKSLSTLRNEAISQSYLGRGADDHSHPQRGEMITGRFVLFVNSHMLITGHRC